MMATYIWLTLLLRNNYKSRGEKKTVVKGSQYFRNQDTRERKETEVPPKCGTAHSLQGCNWLSSQGIETKHESVTWSVWWPSGTVETRVVLHGYQSVQKLRAQVYSEEVIDETISEHYGVFFPWCTSKS